MRIRVPAPIPTPSEPADGTRMTGHELITEREARRLADRPTARVRRRRNPSPGPLTSDSYGVDAAFMPLDSRWYDMNAASTSYASECDKNHRSQELARATLAPRARDGVRSVPSPSIRCGVKGARCARYRLPSIRYSGKAASTSFPGRSPPRRPCACHGGGSGTGRTAGLRHAGPPSRP